MPLETLRAFACWASSAPFAEAVMRTVAASVMASTLYAGVVLVRLKRRATQKRAQTVFA